MPTVPLSTQKPAAQQRMARTDYGSLSSVRLLQGISEWELAAETQCEPRPVSVTLSFKPRAEAAVTLCHSRTEVSLCFLFQQRFLPVLKATMIPHSSCIYLIAPCLNGHATMQRSVIFFQILLSDTFKDSLTTDEHFFLLSLVQYFWKNLIMRKLASSPRL